MLQIDKIPIAEIATLDYIKGLDREGAWGNYQRSSAFASLLSQAGKENILATELYRRYDKAQNAANFKDNLQPKIAILQLHMKEENHYKRFWGMAALKETPKASDYEIVYIQNMKTKTITEAQQIDLSNQLYFEFNTDKMRPSNYYGHSLSVGDVIVIADDRWNQSAYFVDTAGFTKLPEDFLNCEIRNKICNNLDVRNENNLYDTLKKYEVESGITLISEKDTERHFQITGYYLPVFELADKRAAMAIAESENRPKRLYVDLDGTAAEFKQVDTLETLYEKGYFLNLKPNMNVINAVKIIATTHPEIEIYTLSAVLSDSQYALDEKNAWLDTYLPEIDQKHRLFPSCGENKMNYVFEKIGEVSARDCLLDDYTKNLLEWEPPGKGVKALNGINHTRGTWQGSRISAGRKPEELAKSLLQCLEGEAVKENAPDPTANKIQNQIPER